MIWTTTVRYPIDEQLRELAVDTANRLPRRPDFRDPLISTLQAIPLSRVIDEELERFYSDPQPVNMISRMFRRFRAPR